MVPVSRPGAYLLHRWLQPESYLDPKQCDVVYNKEELKCSWPATFVVQTKDQYGQLVHVPNLRVRPGAARIDGSCFDFPCAVRDGGVVTDVVQNTFAAAIVFLFGVLLGCKWRCHPCTSRSQPTQLPSSGAKLWDNELRLGHGWNG